MCTFGCKCVRWEDLNSMPLLSVIVHTCVRMVLRYCFVTAACKDKAADEAGRALSLMPSLMCRAT